MKPVYQLKHMYPTRLGNNYQYHLLGRGTRLFQGLYPLLLVRFHLRFRGPRIRLFLMLGLSRLLYLQKKRICIGMYSWYSQTLRPTVLRKFSRYESAGTRCSCCDFVPNRWLVLSISVPRGVSGLFRRREIFEVNSDIGVGRWVLLKLSDGVCGGRSRLNDLLEPRLNCAACETMASGERWRWSRGVCRWVARQSWQVHW
jgi:hypothetical protein